MLLARFESFWKSLSVRGIGPPCRSVCAMCISGSTPFAPRAALFGLESGQALAGHGDLALLAALARVGALVVAAEEEHDLGAVGVAEHPQEDLFSQLGALDRLAVHAID